MHNTKLLLGKLVFPTQNFIMNLLELSPWDKTNALNMFLPSLNKEETCTNFARPYHFSVGQCVLEKKAFHIIKIFQHGEKKVPEILKYWFVDKISSLNYQLH